VLDLHLAVHGVLALTGDEVVGEDVGPGRALEVVDVAILVGRDRAVEGGNQVAEHDVLGQGVRVHDVRGDQDVVAGVPVQLVGAVAPDEEVGRLGRLLAGNARTITFGAAPPQPDRRHHRHPTSLT
jgi:hypothetical protein